MLNKALLAQIRATLTVARENAISGGLQTDCENALRCLESLVEDEKCNGWSNHETWTVNLWLGNEQGTDEAAREIVAAETLNNGDAAAALKDYCEQLCFGDEMAATMGNDLLNSALGAVNWQEIAQAYAEALADV